MSRISTLIKVFIVPVFLPSSIAWPNFYNAVIQTDEGLRQLTQNVDEHREKRSLSTNFSSQSTYNAANGLVCLVCPPGSYWKSDCMINGTRAVCEPCPHGQYSNSYNIAMRCVTCSTYCIDKNSVVETDCNSINDMKCRCKDGYYNHSKDYGEWMCLPHKECQSGTEMTSPGTPDVDTQCKTCTNGTFSPTASLTAKCLPCFVCSDKQDTKKPCDSKSNTVCVSKDNLLKPDVNVVHVVVPVVVIVAAAACGLIVACLVYRGKIKLARCVGGGTSGNNDEGGGFDSIEDIERTEDIVETEQRPMVHGLHRNIGMSDEATNGVTPDESRAWCEFFRMLSSKILLKTTNEHLAWKDFMRILYSSVYADVNEKNNKIDEICIDYKHDGVKEQIYRCLLAWKTKAADDACVSVVIRALRSNGQDLLANDVELYYKCLFVNNNNNSGTDLKDANFRSN